MKTILYQPLFINPQAYFVFPQLYHSDILIFNRTLTEYEISWVKNNMMCSKQQEPDIDL